MFLKSKKELIVDSVVIISIWLFLLSYFKPGLLFSVTTISGGDTMSDYYPAKYMHDYLLPNFKLVGWNMGWYAGIPMFQYYFPLLFAFAGLLGMLIPLQISVKLVTVLGTFLLPLCTLISMKLFNFRSPMPAFAAILTLPFLFMESNSMWGGNIPSTLAGEFSYSFSLSLVILFFGMLYRGVQNGNWLASNAVTFALISITHVYTMMWALLYSAHFLMKNFRRNFSYLFLVFSCAILLVGFWLAPMITTIGYTTSYSLRWGVDKIETVFPVMILPFVLLSIIGFVMTKRPEENALPMLFALLASLLLYLAAPYMGIVDIRFVPFTQLILTITAAYPLSILSGRLKANWLSPIILMLLVFLWVNSNVTYIGSWIDWNYSGIENKPSANEYFGINNFLNGSISDPRVVFEHSPSYESMGGIRAFESLPLWSGRSTNEGLYMQSSISSPFVFYAQSEYSEQASCPFPNYPCTSVNLTQARKHLEIFNVKNIVVASDKIKTEMSNSTLFRLVKSVGKYDIYELNGSDSGYVKVPEYQPVLFSTNNWKNVSYEWFKKYESLDVPLVFSGNPDGAIKLESKDINNFPRVKTSYDCIIKENVSNEEVSFSTTCLGMPHIIKISYHPYWAVSGADKIYLVSPSFMLVFPKEENVKLAYRYPVIFYLLPLLGLIMLLKFSRTKNISSFAKR